MKRYLVFSVLVAICIYCLCSCDWLPCKHTEAVDAAVAPTCTEAGLTEGKHCTKCGEVLVAQQPVAPLGHTEVLEEAKNPTCTEDGYTAKVHCTVCGVTIIEKQTIPAAHTYGEWETIIEADCFLPGERQRSCSVCDYVESEAIATLSHSFVQNSESGLFSCEKCEATIFAGHLYAAFERQVNWFDAYKACEEMGGYLVTVASKYEQSFIDELINSRTLPTGVSEYYYHAGCIKNTDGWKWITGEEMDYTHWGPQLDGGDQWVMAFTTKLKNSGNSKMQVGDWEDVNHYSKYAFICEWELEIEESEHYFTEWDTVTEVSCFGDGEEYRICTHCGVSESRVVPQLTHSFIFSEANGITACEYCDAVKYDGRIYKIFGGASNISWYDASTECQKLGGHLVTVTSENEEIFLEKYMNYASHTASTWMGGYNDGSKWNWVTDEAFEYSKWEKTQPDCSQGYEFFLHINHAYFGGWNDLNPFSAVKYYICEWENA